MEKSFMNKSLDEIFYQEGILSDENKYRINSAVSKSQWSYTPREQDVLKLKSLSKWDIRIEKLTEYMDSIGSIIMDFMSAEFIDTIKKSTDMLDKFENLEKRISIIEKENKKLQEIIIDFQMQKDIELEFLSKIDKEIIEMRSKTKKSKEKDPFKIASQLYIKFSDFDEYE